MEKQTDLKMGFTKAEEAQSGRVSITANEAVEYREYKRQKKRAEILGAIARSEGELSDFSEVKKVRENAMRLRQAAVRMSVERLQQIGEVFTRGNMRVDCVVGGDGKTLAKVKAYEARAALRLKAREITLVLSPYSVANCRFEEIRKELKKLRRVTAKAILKVEIDRGYSPSVLAQVARMCCEAGAEYFCVPYFAGCERLVLDLKGGCTLQVSGVEDLGLYKKLCAAGVWRIVTPKAWEMYGEWMKEVDKINFPELVAKLEKDAEKGKKEVDTKCVESGVKKAAEVVEKGVLLPVATEEGKKSVAPPVAQAVIALPAKSVLQKTTAESLMQRSAQEKEENKVQENEWKFS